MNSRSLVATALSGAWIFLVLAWLTPARLAAQSEGVAPLDEATEQQRAEAVRQKMYEALGREVAALERQSNALKMVVKLMRPTVVHIEAEKIEPASVRYGRPDQIEEAGSGCIIKINDRFYVLTNGHVIRAARPEDITIRLADGRELHPQRVWSDEKTDVAIMAIAAPELVAARIGNSSELEIGDFVLAIGSPFGLSHSITFGIVSATNRWDFKLGDGVEFQDFIQTDAAINPGNSGGPLINLRGEVIGMNTAIASNSGGNEGIGFSIPINLVMHIAKQLVERSTVTRARLGVILDSKFSPAVAVSVGLTRPRGARIKDVVPNSPAANAKLQGGDVVLDYDGVRIDNDSHLINLVNLTEVGRNVPIAVFRNGRIIELLVKAGSEPSTAVALPVKQPSGD
ncbi:MAG: trypsin-like peptidase domain-containing protein [Pirellulales bacterium]